MDFEEEDRILVTHNPEETETLGCILAGLIPAGTVVALHGPLAAGKTCFVRGVARHYGRAEDVSSPTFTLVNQYGNAPRLYHVDLYRLSEAMELVDLGYEDLFDPDGICLVEWADRAGGWLPDRRLDLTFSHAAEGQRRIVIRNRGVLPAGWSARLSGFLAEPAG